MKRTGRLAVVAMAASLLAVSAARAQSTQNQTQQNQAQQNQNQDQYTGVSHPPPDDTILANEDVAPPAPASAKPSAAIPAARATGTAAPAENPDDDIVTSVPADNAGSSVSLARRGWDPDDGIVNYVPSNPNQLAEGTNIRVRLSEDISTLETRRGATFAAVVAGNVYKDGRVIIPVGSQMRGRVVSVSQGHHLGPHATLRLRPNEIILPDGTVYHLYAVAVESLAKDTRVNQEGGIEASSHYAKDAVEYGATAGAGALAGGLIAGPVGAGVGSAVGAGVVTAHLLTSHPEAAYLPEGSTLIFSLSEPMDLTPTKD